MKLSKTHHTKSALSILLSLCMIVSCFNATLISTDAAIIGSESVAGGITNVGYVKFHANFTGYDDSGTQLSAWNNWSMSQADSNHYYYTFYTTSGQSEKEFGWNVGGSDWGDNWYTMNGEKFSSSQIDKQKEFTQNGGNDKLTTISSDSGWVKVQIDWYGKYGSSSYVKFYQTAVASISSSVSVGSTTLTGTHTTTVTPASSGGTGSTTNSVKVYQGSINGTDVTSTVLSGTTFTAPDVDSTTVYYVVNTATDSKIQSYSVASAAKTITVNPDTTPKILTFTVGGGSSATLKIGEKAALASTTKNAGGNSVTYTSSAPTKVEITNDNKVRALEPCTNVTITASLDGAVSKTVKVSVTTPTLSFSYSPDSVYVNGYSTGTPSSPTANNVHEGTNVSAVSYRIASGETYGTIASNGVVTSTSSAGTVTVEASGTVTYDGVSYSGALGTATVTVKEREPVYLEGLKNDYQWGETDANKMTYNDTTSKYEITRYLYKSATTYGGTDQANPTDTGFKIKANSTWYGASSSGYTINGMSYNNLTMTSTGNNKNVCLTTKDLTSVTAGDIVNGKVPYKFTYDYTSHQLYVYYPMKVTFDRNGHGTAPAAQVVAYNDKTTAPTALTATGYTFGGWYTDSGCTEGHVFDFANTAITADITLYAKWTINTYDINYPADTPHYTLGGDKSATAHYADIVSFTVTPDSTYRIVSVTYTPYGDTAHDATLVNGQYQFSMPAANVAVSVTVIKTYTITLITQTKDMNDDIVVSNVGFTSKTYAINSGSSKPYTVAFKVDAGQSVTFQVGYAAGYGFDSVSGADRTNDTTFSIASASADTTVTVTAKETARTITVKRRYIKADSSSTDDPTPVETLTAGISTQATVSAVPANELTLQNGDYTFDKFTLPDSGVTANPAPNGSNSFSITATAAATIYIDYRETMHTLTLRVSPEGSGSIKQNGSVVTGTIQVGNVTGVTLTPYPATGYKFAAWNPEGYVTQSPPVPSDSDLNPAYTIRINGDSTLTAAFREITHTVTLDFQIYDLDGTTPLQGQTVPSVVLQGAGMFTPITVNAPRLNNSEFMTFEKPSEYEDKITLSEGFVLTDRSIEIKATADVRINVKYKISGNVTVYIDMNDNIGTPILNFKYFINSSGQPVMPTGYNGTTNELECSTAGAQEANLPFEMELVTGSESVYKYTIKMAKLRDEYFIGVHKNGNKLVTHLLKIAYIKVENTSYGAPDGFLIDAIATTTGEMWFKADSTNLKAFDQISYGSVTNTIVGLAGDGESSTTHTLLNNAIQSVHGTGIHTDEAAEYHVQYAGLYTLSGASSVMNNFHYTLNVRINDQVVQDGVTYYFDKWVTCSRENLTHNASGYKVDQATEYPSPTMDLNFTTAPVYSASASSTAYIALYKAVTDEDSKVRVRITYHFNDFDTSDGNYVFDDHQENGQYTKVTAASYTKTVTTDTLVSGYDTLKADTDALTDALKEIAQNNVPYIKSNYFDYTFASNQTALTTVTADEETELENQKLILLDAYLTETAHTYSIVVEKGETPYYQINGEDIEGTYQNTIVLNASGFDIEGSAVWKDSNGKVLASGATYTARFVPSGFNQDANGNDCQIIRVEAGTANAAEHTSVVTNSTTTYDYEGSTEYLHHNFYIVDSCQPGELVGGGVLFATTNGTDYRQTNAATYLGNYGTPSKAASVTARQNFISGILNNDYDTEYVAQTINNVGFRYLPFNAKDDVFRYSDIQHAYLTMYEGTNVNNSNYKGQKLRLFSFMVYDSGTNGAHDYHIVCSEGYGEVDRYINHTAS